MRYYEVRDPSGHTRITTNAKRLRDLPQGTRVWIVTERDGSLTGTEELAVVAGRVVFPRANVRTPKLT